MYTESLGTVCVHLSVLKMPVTKFWTSSSFILMLCYICPFSVLPVPVFKRYAHEWRGHNWGRLGLKS